MLDPRMSEQRRERQQEQQQRQHLQQSQQQQHTEQSVCDSAIFTSLRASAPAMESNGGVTGALPLDALCGSSSSGRGGRGSGGSDGGGDGGGDGGMGRGARRAGKRRMTAAQAAAADADSPDALLAWRLQADEAAALARWEGGGAEAGGRA